MSGPCNFVIFGAAGHLATTKLIPALYRLDLAGRLGDPLQLVAFTRREHDTESWRRHVHEVLESQIDEPLDCAVTFAPVGAIVREALRLVGPGGTVAINAIHLDGVPALDYETHLYRERVLRSVTNLTHEDAREFLELAGRQRLRTVVESFPLAQANVVLERLAGATLEAAAVLVP